MTYRDILVHMAPGPVAAQRARFAVEVAERLQARVLGAFLRSEIPAPFIPPDVEFVLTTSEADRMIAEHAKLVDAAAEMARNAFENAAADDAVGSDWLVLEDARAFANCARRTDLLVVGAGRGSGSGFDPASAVMASGGPALIAPAGVERFNCTRILVAWNGGREAARALHAAWPFIALADQVDVLIVGHKRLGPDGLLQRHFERHGVRADLIEHDIDDSLAGEILRQTVAERGSNLVVMGLYGRSRIGELLLGGVSREMLADPATPLLVCH